MNQHLGTDMEFVSKDNCHHAAHWVALGTCGTDYFVELKIKQAGNNKVQVDVGGDVIEAFLRWIYTDDVKQIFGNTKIFIELYKLSVLWEMDLLRGKLMEKLWNFPDRQMSAHICLVKKSKLYEHDLWKVAIESDLQEIMAALGIAFAAESFRDTTLHFLKSFCDSDFRKRPFVQGWVLGFLSRKLRLVAMKGGLEDFF
uniref:BTB domain-containing protein n=1 Tax=Lankesteria abbotti TaxID=340204 RepID=A0A7S2VUJ4_9APIC